VPLLFTRCNDTPQDWSCTTSFGNNPRALSGVALEMEMHPLLQRVRRRQLARTSAYKRRNDWSA